MGCAGCVAGATRAVVVVLFVAQRDFEAPGGHFAQPGIFAHAAECGPRLNRREQDQHEEHDALDHVQSVGPARGVRQGPESPGGIS
jgi:hypothetical protein